MSTRRKEGAPPGKEKRGTSPSNAGSGTGGRRSPGPPKTNDSTPTGKSIPSYLKPTAASSSALSDASKTQSGKKKPTLTTDKATIERRRSFDKPPSPSRSTKSPVSLNPTLRSSSFSGKTINDPPGANVARRRSFDKPPSPSRSTKSPVSPSPTLRSSSFSGKTSGTLNKGVSERNSKGPKDAGKQSTLHARPAASSVKKNSSVLTKKSEAGRGSLRKKQVESSPEKVEKPDVPEPEPEPQSEDQETFVVDEEEQEYSLLEDEDVTNIIEQIEGESHDNDAVIESPTVTEQHDANIAVAESPTAIENQEDKVDPVEASTDLEHEDEEDRSRDEEIRNQQEDIKEETNHADDHDNNDESGAGDHNEEVEEKEREVDEENEEAIEVDNDRKSNEQLDEKEAEEIVVEEKKEEAVVEEKKEEEDATPRVAHGKKDLTLSNDVIEETRNKLTEQRKNKVKALAGAFETVISLQDPK